MKYIVSQTLLCVSLTLSGYALTAPVSFNFGSDAAVGDALPVTAKTAYTAERGYGVLADSELTTTSAASKQGAFESNALTATEPFYFLADLPEGNYDVALLLGSPEGASDTTVKVESRRLMLEKVTTAPGELVTRNFTVNIRTPEIRDDSGKVVNSVGLKSREIGAPHWDDKLTFEFNGSRPAIAAIQITPNTTAPTVYLAGDSTVTESPREPWTAWGQMLPNFFGPGVAIANHAESGLALSSFRGGRRLDKVLSTLKPGDYVFIQFGHNDQKQKGGGAFTTYAQSLRDYITAIRAKGGKPVLVTSMYRRRFDRSGELQDTLGDYPKAVIAVGKEMDVPVIDLHAMSYRLFTALGPQGSTHAFVHYPAGSFGFETARRDNSHFNPYGAYELALCIVEGIREQLPELAAFLQPDLPPYNPDRPNPPEQFAVPHSPLTGVPDTPDGN